MKADLYRFWRGGEDARRVRRGGRREGYVLIREGRQEGRRSGRDDVMYGRVRRRGRERRAEEESDGSSEYDVGLRTDWREKPRKRGRVRDG